MAYSNLIKDLADVLRKHLSEDKINPIVIDIDKLLVKYHVDTELNK